MIHLPQPAARSAPADYDTLRAPIAALIAQGDHRTALAQLLQIYRGAPLDLRILDDMATCYWQLGDAEPALRLVDLVIEAQPDNAAAWGRRGAMAMSTGDMDTAEAAFAQVLKLAPRTVPALTALNQIRPFPRNGHRAKTLRKLANAPDTPPADRASALNALGRIEDAADKTRSAFRLFLRAKAASPGRYDAAAFDAHLAEQVRRFDPARLPDLPPRLAADPDAPRIAFVVGLPRSGTTLVERALTRHPEVGTIGESPALTRALTGLRARIAARAAWDWVDDADAGQLAAARAAYLDQVAAAFPGAPPRVVIDKMPLNCLEAGFVRAILPEARLIFLSRHPLDTGLSLMMANFHAAHPFSKRLDTIGHLTRCVYGALADARPKLGPMLRRQSYAALVREPEIQLRGLLNHLGLDWCPDCLSPGSGGGIVRTASLTQVRDSITPRALDRWRRYEDELQPLVAALGGPDWIARWAEEDAA